MRKSFIAELKESAPYLFVDQRARMIPDPRPEANDPSMGVVYFTTGNLVFKFSIWRDEYYEVRIAPTFAPTDLYDLTDVLRVLTSPVSVEFSSYFRNWYQFARLLEPNFHSVETAFNEANFDDTKRRLTPDLARQGARRPATSL